MTPKPSKIWADIVVADIQRSIDFYTSFGFKVKEGRHNGDRIASLTIGDDGFIINLSPKGRFEKNAGVQSAAKGGSELIFSISADKKEEVDAWHESLKEIGAKIVKPPFDFPEGWRGMSFADPDDHHWVVLYM